MTNRAERPQPRIHRAFSFPRIRRLRRLTPGPCRGKLYAKPLNDHTPSASGFCRSAQPKGFRKDETYSRQTDRRRAGTHSRGSRLGSVAISIAFEKRRRHTFCECKPRTGQLGVKRRHTMVQVIGLRSNLDGKHPDGSRKRISESKKRRRLYGKGQRRRRC